jgi:hypothetical protein
MLWDVAVRQAVIEKECGSGKTRRGVFAFARFEALNLDDGFGSLSLSLSLVKSSFHSSLFTIAFNTDFPPECHRNIHTRFTIHYNGH